MSEPTPEQLRIAQEWMVSQSTSLAGYSEGLSHYPWIECDEDTESSLAALLASQAEAKDAENVALKNEAKVDRVMRQQADSYHVGAMEAFADAGLDIYQTVLPGQVLGVQLIRQLAKSRDQLDAEVKRLREALKFIEQIGCTQLPNEEGYWCKENGSAHSCYCPAGIARAALEQGARDDEA